MSGLAQAPPPVAPPVGRRALPLLDDAALRALVLRTIAFAALAGYASAHWAALVVGPPGGRVAGVVAIATAAGVLMALAGRAAGGRGIAASAAAAVLALATIWLSFLAIGLPAEMLPPGGWTELGELVDRGVNGLQTAQWPYAGGDADVRLTLLLAIPVAVAPAAALAFWPDERLQPVLRTQALILLLVLYGVGVTEREPSSPLLDGTVLLGLIALWLWLPRLRLRQALAATLAVSSAALVALPVAAALDGDKPWIDYEEWRWGESAAGTQTFDWNHSYGPIDWPREGRTVLTVGSDEGHYWKAQTLNRFDGFRWTTGPSLITRGAFDIPSGGESGWHERMEFTVGDMQSQHIVGAGTIYDVDVQGDELAIVQRDGTARTVDEPLENGTEYDVNAYVPDPTARQMRAAPQRYDGAYSGPTFFSLPAASRPSAPPPQDSDFREGGVTSSGQLVSVGLWNDPSYATPGVIDRIERSPYARTYELARELSEGQQTVYDVVKRIELHLQQNYSYSETPPERAYPLPAFLFRDREGYCQQFSGAMALLLRMNGIPARVAAGFSPGLRDEKQGEYRVRDLDAHSWVEVYFTGIGWVPFDPTPALAPAESQANGQDAASAARGDARDTDAAAREQREERQQDAAPAAGDDDGFGLGPWLLGAIVALALAVAFVLYRRRTRLRHLRPGSDPELEELREALRRLGYDVPSGTTLLGLERRLSGMAGPAATRYVRQLRERRFAPPGRRGSGGFDRRALRRALTKPLGRLGRLRGFLALPPRPFGRSL